MKEQNLPARSEVMPSQTLIKTWQVQNNGSVAWPSGTKLRYLRGTLPSLENEFDVAGSVAAGQTVDVSAVVRTPAQGGRFRALFRLVDSDGAKFGPRLWCDLVVASVSSELPAASAPSAPVSAKATASAPEQAPVAAPATAPPAPEQGPEASETPATPETPSESPAQDPALEAYRVQLEALKAMGWDNEELNLFLLKENKGNVQRVCNWLLEQMRD